MQEIKKVKLFLSSPRDVEEERKKVHEVAAQLNRMLGDHLKISIEVIDWETHVAPDMGRPQEIINRQTDDYDIFVGIMWKRFGTPTGKAGSGTEEEFRTAYGRWEKNKKRLRILFYFSTKPYFPKNLEEIDQLRKVIEFKEEFDQKGLICKYQSCEEFGDLLREHLTKVIYEWFPAKGEKPKSRADFTKYFTYLKSETMYMDIRGLVTGEGKAHQFRIDELYIPLKAAGSAGLPGEKKGNRGEQNDVEGITPREIQLQEALEQPRLIIRGDPGAGKTTFLRLISFALCKEGLGEEPSLGIPKIPWSEDLPVPIFIRIGRLIEHIREWKKRAPHHTPTSEDSPEWIFHFLDKQSKEFNWKVSPDDFRREFEKGRCFILLDGLDETPDQNTREKMGSLAYELINAYSKCRIVLTSRPAAIIGQAIPLGFSLVDIAPLDESAMEIFLTKWCGVLYPEAPEKSCEHKKELSFALQVRPEIRRMARTPVMLTALAVVHWNEHRLPEQRAELYESIINWLFRSRAQRSGRLTIDQCRRLLQKLALAMFTHTEGRQRQVTFHWAAEALADEFVSQEINVSIDNSAIRLAEFFLRDEVVDSGIIVERSHRLEFWHLSFQEYLAAYEVAGFLDKEQVKVLFENDRIYSNEWREPILLLGGVLYKQGIEKVNHLIDEIIAHGPQDRNNEILQELAKKVGLLGGIVNDLAPFNFKPANKRYPEIVRNVMGIFDKETYRNIPVQVRIEAADALGQVGDPRLEDNPKVYIPGCTFWMGVQKNNPKGQNFDPDPSDRESHIHQVKLSSFQISKYPVTVGQYQKFIKDGGYEDERYWRAGGFGEFKGPSKWEDQKRFPSRPVVNVSWYEATAYARWVGGCLPTEAEWERASHGPQQEYRKYPWGNEDPNGEIANFYESKIHSATPVGIFPEDCSPEGVVEMAGNISEWCADWFSEDYYRTCAEKGIVNNPEGPENGDDRVVRGGSFNNDRYLMRCAFRYGVGPRNGFINLGFRVVRAI